MHDLGDQQEDVERPGPAAPAESPRGGEKLRDGHVEARGDSHDRDQLYVELPRLDLLQVFEVDVHALSSLLQRPTSILAKSANLKPEIANGALVDPALLCGPGCALPA